LIRLLIWFSAANWLLLLVAQSVTYGAEAVEEYVWGQQPTSAATEQTRWAKDLELRPTNTPSDVLRLTPGLIIGQHHGGGKGDQILFRGFDSDHGTDFAVFLDGTRSISSAMRMAKATPIFIG
jgi:outer membrane cobalamin receptor